MGNTSSSRGRLLLGKALELMGISGGRYEVYSTKITSPECVSGGCASNDDIDFESWVFEIPGHGVLPFSHFVVRGIGRSCPINWVFRGSNQCIVGGIDRNSPLSTARISGSKDQVKKALAPQKIVEQKDVHSVLLKDGLCQAMGKLGLVRLKETSSYLESRYETPKLRPSSETLGEQDNSQRVSSYSLLDAHFQFTWEDDFVIGGSNALWEYLSAPEVLDIVRNCGESRSGSVLLDIDAGAGKAAAKLIVEAALKAKARKNDFREKTISAAVFFLDYKEMLILGLYAGLSAISAHRKLVEIIEREPKTHGEIYLQETARQILEVIAEDARKEIEAEQRGFLEEGEYMDEEHRYTAQFSLRRNLANEAERDVETEFATLPNETKTPAVDNISDVYQLQEEMKSYGGYFNEDSTAFAQHLENDSQQTVVLCHFNEMENLFEFYFMNYKDMASVVGVGLEYAKVVLGDGWRVVVKEVKEDDWKQACEDLVPSSSTRVFNLPKVKSHMAHSIDDEEFLSFPNNEGRPFLWYIARYFALLVMLECPQSIGVEYSRGCDGASSSSANTNQGSAEPLDGNGDEKAKVAQAVQKYFTENGKDDDVEERKNGKDRDHDGDPNDPDPAITKDKGSCTVVHLELLRHYKVKTGPEPDNQIPEPDNQIPEPQYRVETGLMSDNQIPEPQKRMELLSNNIFPQLRFTFLNCEDKKAIDIMVGDIKFNLARCTYDNLEYPQEETDDVWLHDRLSVSFGASDAEYAKLDYGSIRRLHFEKMDIRDKNSRKYEETEAKDNTFKVGGTGSSGLVGSKFSSSLTGGYDRKSTSSLLRGTASDFESPRVKYLTEEGFLIRGSEDPLNLQRYKFYYDSQLLCPDIDAVQNRKQLRQSPLCNSQTTGFQGTWLPIDNENGSPKWVKYTLEASRLKLQKIFAHVQGERTISCKQIYEKDLYLNHAMTHWDGSCDLGILTETRNSGLQKFRNEGDRQSYVDQSSNDYVRLARPT